MFVFSLGHAHYVAAYALVHDASVIPKSERSNLERCFALAVGFRRERQVVRVNVKQRAHERTLLRIDPEHRSQPQANVARAERRRERGQQALTKRFFKWF